MADLQRKELRGHSTISRTTIEGWPAVFFSLPFIGAGTLIILASFNVIPVKDSSFMPRARWCQLRRALRVGRPLDADTRVAQLE